jgi:hypothetical protein
MDILSIVATCSSLFVTGFTAAMFIVIKFNDLKHLGEDVRELTTIVKDSIGKQEKLAERVACIEGRCAANHQ